MIVLGFILRIRKHSAIVDIPKRFGEDWSKSMCDTFNFYGKTAFFVLIFERQLAERKQQGETQINRQNDTKKRGRQRLGSRRGFFRYSQV